MFFIIVQDPFFASDMFLFDFTRYPLLSLPSVYNPFGYLVFLIPRQKMKNSRMDYFRL